MNSVVSYPVRGVGGKSSYRGNCSPLLIKDLISHYNVSKISDYSCGSNTVGEVAKELDISSTTLDLSQGFDLIDDEIKEMNEFIFYHPAYWDIIKYSGSQYGDKALKNDLSQMSDYNTFNEALNYTVLKQYASLKHNGRMAILVGDIKKQGVLYSMILDMIKPGTIENIVIKMQHNTVSERKNYGNSKFIKIEHEYIVILKRTTAYIESLKVTKNYQFDVRDSYALTWKDVVQAVLMKSNKPMRLNEIYCEVQFHKKARANAHFKEKIRQVLNSYDVFKKVDTGVYGLVG